MSAVARRTSRTKLRFNCPFLGTSRGSLDAAALDIRALYLASFEVLLHRYSGADEVGILAMMRGGQDSHPFGGVEAMVVRADLSSDPEFFALADRAGIALRSNLINCGDIAQAFARGGADNGENHAIQAAFIYDREACNAISSPYVTTEAQADFPPDGPHLDNVDLSLIVHETFDAMSIGINYAQNLFSASMIQELGDSFQALLCSVAKNLHQPISRVNLLNPSQLERVLVQWNDTAVPFSRDRHTEHIFDTYAARSPERVALRYENQSVTYDALRHRSNQLAWHLRDCGIGPGTLVAICTDRSPDMVVGLLGILKTGAAYVPLDPGYPPDRLAFMLSDAQCSALVTQEQWRSSLPTSHLPVIRLDVDRQILDAQPREDLPTTASPEDLAYVIYTSGSTGKPKGVAVRRCAFTNFLNAMRTRLDIVSDDVFLAITTISFDIAGLELFLPLTTGARVVLTNRDDAMQPDRLAHWVDEERVTVMQATPATWRMLLDSQWVGRGDLRILCGGEAMTRDLADRLLRKGSAVWNMYGPTETTVWSTMCRVESGGPISIGRPIDNTEIYLLDKHLQCVPVGAIGELHIGGVGLARDYLHRPELTAEKFIAHPFNNEPATRLYKTGDLARYWPDGQIECLGRVDHQVKIRGFRIELPEIEARMSDHPAVKQAAAVARDDGDGGKYLAAYWVPEDSPAPISTEDLRAFLAEVLPAHMVPSVFVSMKTLPLTPNGKIDRRALPAPDRHLCERNASYLAPRNITEQQLVEIWENLLEARPIGIRDDFFLLGGHSLAAARLVVRIEAATGVSIPVSSLLSSPTIEGLARLVNGETQGTSGIVVPFRQTGTRPPLFMAAGVGGHVLIFRELAELLGDDQPVYGLQGIGLDGTEAPLNRMEDIAARYVQEILSVQPQGPWVVAGWSMGGAIAYEMGLQMLDQGLDPEAIIIMDTYAPWAMSWQDRARIHLDSFRRRSWRSRWGYAVQRVKHRVEVMRRQLGFDNISADLDGRTAELVRSSSLAQFAALRHYQPKPMMKDVVLLRADQTAEIHDPRAADPHLGWGTLVRGNIHVLPIAGNHTGIFTGTNVQVLAAALTQCLTPRNGHA